MGQDLERDQHLDLLDSLPWLDASTAELVKETTHALGDHHEVQAVILFGSVARHEERPLDDDEPAMSICLRWLIKDRGAPGFPCIGHSPSTEQSVVWHMSTATPHARCR